MSSKQRNALANFNRVVILALTTMGLLMDGYQRADLPSTLALLVWLWLPLCARLEANLLRKLNTDVIYNPARFGEQ